MNENKIFLITGSRGEGKTEYLRRVCGILSDKSIVIKGFYSQGIYNEGGEKQYELISLCDDSREILCKTGKEAGWFETCRRYSFNPRAIQLGRRLIRDERNDAGLIAIDEVGKLETERKVWYTAIEELLTDSETPMIWTVRKSFIDTVKSFFSLNNVKQFEVGKTRPEEIAKVIADDLNR